MSDALIDLGEMPRRGGRRVPAGGEPRRPFPLRAALAALAAALVVLPAGAAHRGPPDPPVVIAARLGDMLFPGTDRIFVVSAGPEPAASAVPGKIVSAYAVPGGELLSRTTVAVAGAIFDVAAVGRMILVSYQVDTVGAEATVALTAGSGKALWRHPARLLAVSGPGGLVLLRENSPQAGNVDWFGLDLGTGAVRWSLRQQAGGFTTAAGFTGTYPRYLVTATYSGSLEVRDARGGGVLATARVPVPVGQVGNDLPVWTTDGLVLVGGTAGVTAYGLPDLALRWRSPADLTGRWVQPACAGLICSLSWRGGLRVLDATTGAPLWDDDRWNYADQVGAYLMAGDSTGRERPRSTVVLEPATGAVRGDFGRWHVAGPEDPDGTVIGIREQRADDVVWYARLDPRAVRVRVLGAAERVSGDCQAVAGALVCRRIDASVGIWRLK